MTHHLPGSVLSASTAEALDSAPLRRRPPRATTLRLLAMTLGMGSKEVSDLLLRSRIAVPGEPCLAAAEG